jgi:flagellar basal-body rod protein FlgF
MDPLTISAASGLRVRLESLDLLANNLANAATAGYKSDREFYSLYTAPEVLEDNAAPSTLPVVERRWTDFSQGTLTPTGNPLDLALAKGGFFSVAGPSGTLYTRNGGFHLSASGVLSTAEGYPVLSSAGQPIQASGSGPLEISSDGSVRQDGAEIARIAVVDFARPEALDKAGKNYFRAGDQSGARPAAEVEIQPGKLESSNVAAPEAAVRLVGLMRQFEMLQKAVTLDADMGRRAIEEVAKV